MISLQEQALVEIKDKCDAIEVSAFHTDESFLSISLLEIDKEFHNKLIKGYEEDEHFAPIFKALRKYAQSKEDEDELIVHPHLPYCLSVKSKENHLLFYRDPSDQHL